MSIPHSSLHCEKGDLEAPPLLEVLVLTVQSQRPELGMGVAGEQIMTREEKEVRTKAGREKDKAHKVPGAPISVLPQLLVLSLQVKKGDRRGKREVAWLSIYLAH